MKRLTKVMMKRKVKRGKTDSTQIPCSQKTGKTMLFWKGNLELTTSFMRAKSIHRGQKELTKKELSIMFYRP